MTENRWKFSYLDLYLLGRSTYLCGHKQKVHQYLIYKGR